ncbi:hypothetical protein FIBSPDRAFT_891111 [Athelia psychrophila]|uniref:Secreted protein n=1 Tax=Athelia psychrophila TaxID=1759441 RepID=A0A166K0M6_9AGAM|nr:hypothetical protein FIBSPDRAFT_891111 [Fibularhizoctonia sp. CBS 109695]
MCASGSPYARASYALLILHAAAPPAHARSPASALHPMRGFPGSYVLPGCFVGARGHIGRRVRLACRQFCICAAGPRTAAWFRFLTGQLRAGQLRLFTLEAEPPHL